MSPAELAKLHKEISHPDLLAKAHAAATKAILQRFKDGHVEHAGNCGFAWVHCDLRNPFTRWCKKQVTPEDRGYYGSDGYQSGWRFWCPGDWPTPLQQLQHGITVYAQDIDFHRAGAAAFLAVLAEHQINGWVGSRLD